MKTVLVRVQGGVVYHVEVPDGVQVLVRDYDAEGTDADMQSKDENGDLCIETKWGCHSYDILDGLKDTKDLRHMAEALLEVITKTDTDIGPLYTRNKDSEGQYVTLGLVEPYELAVAYLKEHPAN